MVSKIQNKRSHAIYFKEPTLTKQSERDNANINVIMAKYEASGQIPQINERQAQFGDFSEVKTYQEALQQIEDAQTMFESLPSKIRTMFDNNPENFLEYTNNPDNHAKMREIGLLPPLPEMKNDESNDEKSQQQEEKPKTAE